MLLHPLIDHVVGNPGRSQGSFNVTGLNGFGLDLLQRGHVDLEGRVVLRNPAGCLQLVPDSSCQIFVGRFPTAHRVAEYQPVLGQAVPHGAGVLAQQLAHALEVQTAGLVHHNAHGVGGGDHVPLRVVPGQTAAED